MNSKIVKCYKTWTVNCSGGSELSFYPGRYFQAFVTKNGQINIKDEEWNFNQKLPLAKDHEAK